MLYKNITIHLPTSWYLILNLGMITSGHFNFFSTYIYNLERLVNATDHDGYWPIISSRNYLPVNIWRQTYGSIMHTRAMQVKTCQCLNPRRRPSATIRIESACGVATDWVTCGFLNPNQINNVNGAWRLMYSREVRIYRIAKREMSNLLRRGWGESATVSCAGIQQP